jgi:acylphosphatase
MNKRLECVVSGRVQMVMYRDFVKRNARSLGLSGAVQNNKDGTVYVLAEGSEEKLQQLLTLLHKGSVFSRVDSVKEKWREPSNMFKGFEIVY